MRKKGLPILPLLLAVIISLSGIFWTEKVYATEGVETEANAEESETEIQIPESYYLPIESNEVDGWPQGPQIEAEAAVVMDASTGAFVYSKNMMAKEYPASITKLMTALVAIEQGDLDKKIKFSREAVYGIESGSSHIGLQPGEKLTLRQALYGLMLESANDAANGIAEKVGGSIDKFVQMMNNKAKELGCVNTNFTNPHGLHNEDHYTCAYDMALITKAAFDNKILAEIAGTSEYSIPETNKVKEVRYFLNHHKMLTSDEYRYGCCVGGKTGFTSDALNTLVTVTKEKKQELICVVLRTNGAGKTYEESRQLLEYSSANFSNRKQEIGLAKLDRADILNAKLVGKASVLMPEVLEEKVLDIADSVKLTLPADADLSKVTSKFLENGRFVYFYSGWQVGSTALKFQPPIVNIAEPDMPQRTADTETQSQKMPEESLEPGFLDGIKEGWNMAAEWAYTNDIAVAAIGLILIIILIPVLIIAYVRNRSSQKIRKARKREREERMKREAEIDLKSALEIEEEIRAELEKERLAKEREEARRQEAEEAEKEIAEAEKILEQVTGKADSSQKEEHREE